MIPSQYQKTYLSRSMTRSMAADHPIGDPFGGPAYGERREPVSAIAAVVSIYVGATAATAVAATTFAMVMGGMMIAGGAASLIGNISGNKKLQMIGGAVAAVGGIGLAGASLFAEAASTSSSAGALDGLAEGTGAGTAIQPSSPVFDTVDPTAPYGAASVGEAPTQIAGQTVGFDPSTVSGQAQLPVSDVISPTSTLDTANAGEVSKGLISEASNTGVASDAAPQFDYKQGDFVVKDPASSLVSDSSATQTPAAYDPNAQYAETVKTASTTSTPTTANEYGTIKLDGQVVPESQIKPLQDAGIKIYKLPDGNLTTTAPKEGLLSNVSGFMKDNKEMISMGGQLVKGITDYAYPTQQSQAATDYYNANANLADSTAALRNEQTAQLQYEKDRAKRVAAVYDQVKYKPISPTTQPGLIAGAKA